MTVRAVLRIKGECKGIDGARARSAGMIASHKDNRRLFVTGQEFKLQPAPPLTESEFLAIPDGTNVIADGYALSQARFMITKLTAVSDETILRILNARVIHAPT